ncbi:MAG: asparagine--tRNA ligase [Candidatus Bathyarchaeota archaeon]|jgi:asparaginyl-tRNA synthetase
MSFTPIQEILTEQYEGKQVSIRGWIYRKRETKQTIFLIVRDGSSIVQCTAKVGTPSWKDASRVTIESSVTLSGIVTRDKRAPGGFEVAVNDLEIVGLAEAFPITRDKSEEFLRDVRHLWLRSRKMNAILKVRSEVLKFVHECFKEQSFIEVSPPMFISSAVEGGATLFGLKYFDRDMYLTQSAQLHLEALIHSYEKVYCIAPSFRAEKSRTIRHLTEYWHVEAEEAFTTLDDLMRLEENLVSYICQETAKQCRSELELVGIDTSALSQVKTPFPRITYNEAIEKLHEKGFKIPWGEDLGFNEEKALGAEYEKPFFIHAYPKKIRAFYVKAYPDNPKLVMSVDLLVPHIGELATGGARVDDQDELMRNLEEFGLPKESYSWYIDLRKYGTVPHTGFGMGVERLLAWMLNLGNIMDAIPFPRTIRRAYP